MPRLLYPKHATSAATDAAATTAQTQPPVAAAAAASPATSLLQPPSSLPLMQVTLKTQAAVQMQATRLNDPTRAAAADARMQSKPKGEPVAAAASTAAAAASKALSVAPRQPVNMSALMPAVVAAQPPANPPAAPKRPATAATAEADSCSIDELSSSSSSGLLRTHSPPPAWVVARHASPETHLSLSQSQPQSQSSNSSSEEEEEPRLERTQLPLFQPLHQPRFPLPPFSARPPVLRRRCTNEMGVVVCDLDCACARSSARSHSTCLNSAAAAPPPSSSTSSSRAAPRSVHWPSSHSSRAHGVVFSLEPSSPSPYAFTKGERLAKKKEWNEEKRQIEAPSPISQQQASNDDDELARIHRNIRLAVRNSDAYKIPPSEKERVLAEQPARQRAQAGASVPATAKAESKDLSFSQRPSILQSATTKRISPPNEQSKLSNGAGSASTSSSLTAHSVSIAPPPVAPQSFSSSQPLASSTHQVTASVSATSSTPFSVPFSSSFSMVGQDAGRIAALPMMDASSSAAPARAPTPSTFHSRFLNATNDHIPTSNKASTSEPKATLQPSSATSHWRTHDPMVSAAQAAQLVAQVSAQAKQQQLQQQQAVEQQKQQQGQQQQQQQLPQNSAQQPRRSVAPVALDVARRIAQRRSVTPAPHLSHEAVVPSRLPFDAMREYAPHSGPPQLSRPFQQPPAVPSYAPRAAMQAAVSRAMQPAEPQKRRNEWLSSLVPDDEQPAQKRARLYGTPLQLSQAKSQPSSVPAPRAATPFLSFAPSHNTSAGSGSFAQKSLPSASVPVSTSNGAGASSYPKFYAPAAVMHPRLPSPPQPSRPPPAPLQRATPPQPPVQPPQSQRFEMPPPPPRPPRPFGQRSAAPSQPMRSAAAAGVKPPISSQPKEHETVPGLERRADGSLWCNWCDSAVDTASDRTGAKHMQSEAHQRRKAEGVRQAMEPLERQVKQQQLQLQQSLQQRTASQPPQVARAQTPAPATPLARPPLPRNFISPASIRAAANMPPPPSSLVSVRTPAKATATASTGANAAAASSTAQLQLTKLHLPTAYHSCVLVCGEGASVEYFCRDPRCHTKLDGAFLQGSLEAHLRRVHGEHYAQVKQQAEREASQNQPAQLQAPTQAASAPAAAPAQPPLQLTMMQLPVYVNPANPTQPVAFPGWPPRWPSLPTPAATQQA